MLSRILVAVLSLVVSVSAFAAEEGKPATSVDPAKLKALLPETLNDLKRGEVNTQQMTMGDTAMSVAETSYAKPDDQSESPAGIDLTFADYGSNSPMGQATAAWANMTFSRESDGEYEKTTKVQGFPALESYNKEGKYGSVTVFVASRYIVTFNVTNIAAEKMVELANGLPLKKLAEVK